VGVVLDWVGPGAPVFVPVVLVSERGDEGLREGGVEGKVAVSIKVTFVGKGRGRGDSGLRAQNAFPCKDTSLIRNGESEKRRCAFLKIQESLGKRTKRPLLKFTHSCCPRSSTSQHVLTLADSSIRFGVPNIHTETQAGGSEGAGGERIC